MKKITKIKLVKKALFFGLAFALALTLAFSCAAACLNIISFNKRTADTSDVPPIGEGLESGAEGIIGGIESEADNIMDGAESIFDGNGMGNTDGITDDGGIFETNIPDSNIGGAFEDHDSDGISDPTDPDDDNDGTPDKVDTDADNDGIRDDADPDPDGDGVNESKMSGKVVGIVIAVLVIGAIAILAYALMPKKKH